MMRDWEAGWLCGRARLSKMSARSSRGRARAIFRIGLPHHAEGTPPARQVACHPPSRHSRPGSISSLQSSRRLTNIPQVTQDQRKQRTVCPSSPCPHQHGARGLAHSHPSPASSAATSAASASLNSSSSRAARRPAFSFCHGTSSPYWHPQSHKRSQHRSNGFQVRTTKSNSPSRSASCRTRARSRAPPAHRGCRPRT